MIQDLWSTATFYGNLSGESKLAWEKIMRKREIPKNEFFVPEGKIPKTVGFVLSGLFSQYYCSDEGETVIKKFFHEGNFMASLSALVNNDPSLFFIKALENSSILEFSFGAFKELTIQYADIAALYIKYLEKNWVVEKELLEISFRHDDASTRYLNFLKTYPGLDARVKQHEIASYLGITPTQLSRIRSELSNSSKSQHM